MSKESRKTPREMLRREDEEKGESLAATGHSGGSSLHVVGVKVWMPGAVGS